VALGGWEAVRVAVASLLARSRRVLLPARLSLQLLLAAAFRQLIVTAVLVVLRSSNLLPEPAHRGELLATADRSSAQQTVRLWPPAFAANQAMQLKANKIV
jgi:hypothetical protein